MYLDREVMEEADDKQQGTNDEAAEKKEVCCSQV
jgi:hypothetical protein